MINLCEGKNSAECCLLPPTEVIAAHSMYSLYIIDGLALNYIHFYGIEFLAGQNFVFGI